MSIVCLDWESAHIHGETWISHHRLRHRVFVQRQGWHVPSHNGLEYDQFDTPAAKYILWVDDYRQARGVVRLIPTTQPYMVETLWPELVDGEKPRASTVWEATRFGCDRNVDRGLRRRIVAELICGCQEFGIANGIHKYLGVMPLDVFRRVLVAAGCPVTVLGSSMQTGRRGIAAGYIDVSRDVLATVQRRTDVRGLVLQQLPGGLSEVDCSFGSPEVGWGTDTL